MRAISTRHRSPDGVQLRRVACALEQEQPKYSRGVYDEQTRRSVAYNEMGVYWPFLSLYQKGWRRTPEEEASHDAAMSQSGDLWYAHQGTTVYLLPTLTPSRGGTLQQSAPHAQQQKQQQYFEYVSPKQRSPGKLTHAQSPGSRSPQPHSPQPHSPQPHTSPLHSPQAHSPPLLLPPLQSLKPPPPPSTRSLAPPLARGLPSFRVPEPSYQQQQWSSRASTSTTQLYTWSSHDDGIAQRPSQQDNHHGQPAQGQPLGQPQGQPQGQQHEPHTPSTSHRSLTSNFRSRRGLHEEGEISGRLPFGTPDDGWPTFARCCTDQVKRFTAHGVGWRLVLDLGRGWHGEVHGEQAEQGGTHLEVQGASLGAIRLTGAGSQREVGSPSIKMESINMELGQSWTGARLGTPGGAKRRPGSAKKSGEQTPSRASRSAIGRVSSGVVRPYLRAWPISPDAFDALMETKAFARKSDRRLAQMLFRKVSIAQLRGVRSLRFDEILARGPGEVSSGANTTAASTATSTTAAASTATSSQPVFSIDDATSLSGCLGFCARLERLSLSGPPPASRAALRHRGSFKVGPPGRAKTLGNVGISPESCEALFSELRLGSLVSVLWHLKSRTHPQRLSEQKAEGKQLVAVCYKPSIFSMNSLSLSLLSSRSMGICPPWLSPSSHHTLSCALWPSQGTLLELDLRDNCIGDGGLRSIATSAARRRTMPRLQTLLLDSNCIGDVGVRALAQAVEIGVFGSLQQLSLSYNCVSSSGLVALMLAATRQPMAQLERLNLASNRVGSDGVKAVVKAVQAGALASLEGVRLEANPAGGKPVVKAIDRRKVKLEMARRREAAAEATATGLGGLPDESHDPRALPTQMFRL